MSEPPTPGVARAAAGHLPPAVQRRVRLRGRAPDRALPRRARHQPRLRLAVPARRARAACTATTSSTHNALEPRARRRRRSSTRLCRAARRTAWARSSTSCPTTWASAPTTPGGSTCSRTGRRRPYASFFDIDWQPRRAGRRATSVLLPVLGDQYGRVLEARRAAARLRCRGRQLRLRYYEHRFPIDPRSYPRCSLQSAADRARQLAAAELTELAERPRRARAAARDELAAHGGRARRARRGAQGGARARWRDEPELARRDRGRGRALNGAPASRRASTRSHACSRRRPTGSPTGASPPTRSTTGASSTSTSSPRCAWRAEVFEATHRLVLRPDRRGQGRRRCASTTPTASSTRSGTSSACSGARCCRP